MYFDVDFDKVTYEEIKTHFDNIINPECLTFLQTRGGLHVLIKLDDISPEFSKTWYNKVTAIPGCDVSGDNMIPVPGCTQGNFVPHFR